MGRRFKNGYLRAAVVLMLSTLGLVGCNSDSDDDVSSQVQALSFNVTNTTDDTPLSNLEVRFVFDVSNQSQDFRVSVTDVSGREVAGYVDGTAYQSNVLLVPDSGIVPISISAFNVSSSGDSRASLTLVTHGKGFFSNSQYFDLTQTSMETSYWVEVMPKSSSDDVATAYAAQIVAMSGSSTASTLTLSTPIQSTTTSGGQILDGASASLTIPAGTTLLAEDGSAFVPVGDITASLMMFSADPQGIADADNNPLYLFPGGLSPQEVTGDLPADIRSATGLTFISAGFVAIELEDEAGNQVKGFDGSGIRLTFDVPKSTTNPNTGAPLSLNDQTIPIWSYTDTTGKWHYEGEASIVKENSDTFTLSKQITHLSYYNLDWYDQDRCKLDINVVDQNGEPNNQKLRLSFAKAGGGWAYKPSGWGDNPEKLEINRVPAFAGHFDLLDSQGNSLLASIEVDSQVTSVASGDTGLDLDDFCFGLSGDNTKSLKATLNITNPPTIDIQPTLKLVCPTNTSVAQAVTSGRYYLYSGYSYESSGEISGDTLSLTNLLQDGLYRLYYYGGQTWGQVEFTASANLDEIQLMSLELCDKIDQTVNVRLVCLDDQQDVTREKAAPSAYYWMYNQDYGQYLWGQVDEDGTAQESRAVDTVQYEGSAYVRLDNQYYWGERQTVTASDSQPVVFDIALPSDHTFCSEVSTVDYSGSTLVIADTQGMDIAATTTLTVTLKDGDNQDYTQSGGTLELASSPSGLVFTDITDNADGTYSATVSATDAGSYTISATVGGEVLSNTAPLTITAVDTSLSAVSPDTVAQDEGSTTNVTLTLRQADNSVVGHGGHTVTATGLAIDFGLVSVATTDHDDGTYTLAVTCDNGFNGSQDINVNVNAVVVDTLSVSCNSI
ncbi:Ig-like domain-containing protein [Vibrio proteolyticus]|uniref:Big-1 domain-containing protein n=1 Tax=Vibrio proteolyticus NBRC 13287 TaxID=1219065 RepID=U3A5A0_VIBPR|nr:Ig-like domain-containing protein [Vibrio proteolyticus]GAD68865.1 hypothetical protein VPR01S_20_00450 [Vibrio proteolyticus NBRC 13287]